METTEIKRIVDILRMELPGSIVIAPDLFKDVETIRKDGYIFESHKASKTFRSCASGKEILPGTTYYSVIMGGGGLGWIKHPDRILLDEVDTYLEKWGRK